MVVGAVPPGPAPKPNIIVILADDLGFGDLSSFGSATIQTPNIDQIASEGLRFTDFYAAPACGPDRAQLMTGSLAPRVSLNFSHIPNAPSGLSQDETTLAELMKSAGYATKIIGKWHLGDAPEFLPLNHGFDEFFGIPYSNDMWPFNPKICPHEDEDPRLTEARARAALTGYDRGTCIPVGTFPDLPLYRNGTVVEVNSDQTTLLSRFKDEAIAFIESKQNEPFFLYLVPHAPHVPLFPSPEFLGSSDADLYGDVVEELDSLVGEIDDRLHQLGLAENTLLIFTSDNGPWLAYGIDGGSAGALRGGKHTVFEGGIRVPTLMRWGGMIPPGSVSAEPATHMDLYPTLAALAGATLPDNPIDGKDIRALMTQQPGATSPHDSLLFYRSGNARDVFGSDQTLNLRALRQGPWKLHVTMSGTTVVAGALFDLSADVGESTDVSALYPAVVADLRAEAQARNDDLRANTRAIGFVDGVPIVTAPTGTADLTEEGTSDWVHWGRSTATDVNRKSGVGHQISELITIGGSALRFQGSGERLRYQWSDGAPTASANISAGLYIGGLGKGFEITAPAGAEERTLVVYLGGYKTRGRIEVDLSDGSSPAYAVTVEHLGAAFDRRVAVTYRAAGPGQSLTFRYIQDRSGGNISIQAATLQGSGTPPVNQPPVLAPIGNRSVQVGNTLSIAVSATDADGPAPLVLAAAPLPAAASFVDNGNGTGQLSWAPASGALAGSPYSITFTATDAGGAGLSTSETIAVTVTAASTGLLTPTLTTPGGTADLSTEGGADWAHWGLDTAASVNRKNGVAPQIGTLSTLGGSALRFENSARLAYAWSNGTPVASANTGAGLYIGGLGKGFEITAPADTVERTLVVYLGGFKTRGRIEVGLSDGSAPVYTQTVENLSTAFDRRLALTYRAAGAGQTLTVRYIQDRSGGNVTFQAATLQGSGTPPVNQPPVLAPIGNRSVQVGNTLSIAVSATDADGPAPLVLAAAPLPAAASFVDNGNGTGQLSWTPTSGALAGSPYSITFTATDAGGAGLSTSETVDVTVTAASDGLLTPTLTTPSGTADLSSEGDADWAHWGLDTAASVNRKNGVAPQIGTLNSLGGSALRFENSARLAYAWSNGTPVASANTGAGLYIGGLGKGFEITAPADTVERTLVVYLGGFKTRGRIEVGLSDNSAPVYTQTVENLSTAFDRRLALTYRAAGAGQTLTVRYIQDRSGGNVTFQAATLQGSDTPPVNQPPVLAPIGNRSVQVGNTLSIAVSATDADGPAPLVLAAAPLPAAASFVDNGNGTGQLSWTPTSGALAGSPYSITFTATDAGGAGLSTSETVDVTVTAASDGLLTPTLTTPGGTADLSSEGDADWAHWGLDTAASVNRKNGVAPQIGTLNSLGGSALRFENSARVAYAWSNGTPVASANTGAGLYIGGLGKGFEITAPADTVERTLVVYLGGFKTRGRIEVSLSDNSAPVYSQTVENLDAAFDRRLALTYRAAGAGQTLTVRYIQDRSGGNVTFQAAVLDGGGSTVSMPTMLAPMSNHMADAINGADPANKEAQAYVQMFIVNSEVVPRAVGTIAPFNTES
ncbi:sulfatase family protein [Thiocapsa rosea]|nr:sulfatase [Thiocapsa rosea]